MNKEVMVAIGVLTVSLGLLIVALRGPSTPDAPANDPLTRADPSPPPQVASRPGGSGGLSGLNDLSMTTPASGSNAALPDDDGLVFFDPPLPPAGQSEAAHSTPQNPPNTLAELASHERDDHAVDTEEPLLGTFQGLPPVSELPGAEDLAHVTPGRAASDEPTFGNTLAADARGQRTYVVKSGDTLSRISQQFYGTGARYRLIEEANPGLDARNLSIGQRLVIPASGRSSAGASMATGVASERVYVVQANDSYYTIAKAHLGDGNRWREIQGPNADILPEDLRVGDKLRLPAPGAVATASAGGRPAGGASAGGTNAHRGRR